MFSQMNYIFSYISKKGNYYANFFARMGTILPSLKIFGTKNFQGYINV